jgi:sec-independent protein translocase protein TatA
MNLGPPEIILILIVALIVFGPKKLPEVGRQVGAAVREMRKMQDSVRSELNSVIQFDADAPASSSSRAVDASAGAAAAPALEEPDHTALPAPPPPPEPALEPSPEPGFDGPSQSFS